MSQHDYVINNDSGASVRADINSALQAILSQNSGTSAPTSTSAGTMWLDTTGGAPYTLKIRDAGNNHWLTIASVTDPGSDGNLSVSAIEGTNVLSTGESGGNKFLREDGDGSCSWQVAGMVLQVVSSSNAYTHTLSGLNSRSSTLPVLSASGTTWELTMSNVNQGNKILISGDLQIGQTSANSNAAFLLQMQVDSGSYADVAIGNSEGSRTRVFSGSRPAAEYELNPCPINHLVSPTISGSTGTIKFKILVSQGAGSSRDIPINHTGVDNAEGYTAISHLTGMEIQS